MVGTKWHAPEINGLGARLLGAGGGFLYGTDEMAGHRFADGETPGWRLGRLVGGGFLYGADEMADRRRCAQRGWESGRGDCARDPAGDPKRDPGWGAPLVKTPGPLTTTTTTTFSGFLKRCWRRPRGCLLAHSRRTASSYRAETRGKPSVARAGHMTNRHGSQGCGQGSRGLRGGLPRGNANGLEGTGGNAWGMSRGGAWQLRTILK
jgi:hypothetical protein